MTIGKQTQRLLAQLKTSTQAIFGPNLVGIYLHGSLALGDYRFAISDLDYLIVVNQVPTASEKMALLKVAAEQLWPLAPAKGLEFHVMTKQETLHGQHPYRFCCHLSQMQLPNYQKDPAGYVQGMQGRDPDLATHLTVAYAKGIVLAGAPIKSVFAPVPQSAYLDSVWADVRESAQAITDSPVYTALNLCRLAAYLADGQLRSKAGGGRWGLVHLAASFQPVISWVLAQYTGKPTAGGKPEPIMMQAFAQAMAAQIQQKLPAAN